MQAKAEIAEMLQVKEQVQGKMEALHALSYGIPTAVQERAAKATRGSEASATKENSVPRPSSNSSRKSKRRSQAPSKLKPALQQPANHAALNALRQRQLYHLDAMINAKKKAACCHNADY